ncbi:MAG: methyltransferase domain-containing protein [Tepidisphaeraceae bacterium]|jgi:ubiquinone/menaquinone biosynthesis C-methylase UbiE
MKRVLNVGGGNKDVPLPPQYAGFQHVLLDIDPRGSPDILCDARQLMSLEAAQFDAVLCDHNLEHYYRHDIPKVLAGFSHVLKEGGFADIRVPDISEVMRASLARGLDIDDVLYQSTGGPVRVLDVLYGFSTEIEKTGTDFWCHKTGFTQKSLSRALLAAGFSKLYGCATAEAFEIEALAFKGKPDDATRAIFKLPQD